MEFDEKIKYEKLKNNAIESLSKIPVPKKQETINQSLKKNNLNNKKLSNEKKEIEINIPGEKENYIKSLEINKEIREEKSLEISKKSFKTSIICMWGAILSALFSAIYLIIAVIKK